LPFLIAITPQISFTPNLRLSTKLQLGRRHQPLATHSASCALCCGDEPSGGDELSATWTGDELSGATASLVFFALLVRMAMSSLVRQRVI